jgi:EAL domain-containing protein (putative c-di-GMP-specific phosphodiesterase class I)
VGVAVRTADEGPAELLQHADAARARAKELGRDRMEVFDQLMRSHADEQLRIDRELRAALDTGALTLHYQPIVEMHSGAIAGAEALLRWQHEEHGLLPPARFLPVAEETGTITRIGRWVVNEAVRQARQWIDGHADLETFTVSVNLSARELTAPGLAEHVARVLEAHGWPADQLMLELTEGSLIAERETTMRVMGELKDVGVRLAIDDFGTGFSSLSELHRFPVDTVKVDPSFVADLTASGAGSPVTTAVLHMAGALGLVVVAEGVERPDQHRGLQALRCHLAQGFLFAHPAPPEEIERAWLDRSTMQRTIVP